MRWAHLQETPCPTQQNFRLTEDGAVTSGSFVGRPLDSVGRDNWGSYHQIGPAFWWQKLFWVSLSWCTFKPFKFFFFNRSSSLCYCILNVTILKMQYFKALQILFQKDRGRLWITKLYLQADHGFHVNGIFLAFVSLVKAERIFPCQAFSVCRLPTYLTCLPSAPLLSQCLSHRAISTENDKSLSHRPAWLEWHFLWMTTM